MDLIYADETRKDIGVISSYDLDMAYGKDENDFTCSVDRSDHCCSKGYFIYAEGTEYGGIVDRVKVDTESGLVSYMGRTWHGILESKIICPQAKRDYFVVDGDANEVLQDVISNLGLTSLFAASSETAGIDVANYRFDRYIPGYTGIRKMLKEYDMKLGVSWKNGMIVLSAVPINDYSQDDEFDASQVNFSIEKNYRPVNHIICLGTGELRKRHVIHVFTDENGGIQDYLHDPDHDPVEDSDYILDRSAQVLFGSDEVTEVYDLSNAETVTNYVKLTSKPSDWDTKCTKYFTFTPGDDGGSYNPVEMREVPYKLQKKKPYDWTENYDDYYTYANGGYSPVSGQLTYRLLTSKPGNWEKAYTEYYVKPGSDYVNVSGVNNTEYVLQRSVPNDWRWNYGNYYYIYSDGLTSEYRNVEGLAYAKNLVLTQKPTDWDRSFGSYYRRATARDRKTHPRINWYAVTRTAKGAVPRWRPKMYYAHKIFYRAPVWKAAQRYTRVEETVAPTWEPNKYYQKIGMTAPTWEVGTYYTYVNLTLPAIWRANKYYRETYDHYAQLVEGALEHLAEAHASNEMEINLAETDQIYDIGDIVGTREEVTGMEAIQEVVKKIITIKNDDIVIRYEVD